ncbi:MAG TPA: extracellular matrix/biofilm biosynthesis regulator RemA family protein [Dehalococcoidia bacterium]
MCTELVHIGFGNVIAVNRVIALLSINQQPIKRLIREAREKGLLIDATHGRKAKAAVLFDTGHMVLAAVTAETIAHRLATASMPSEEKVELGSV